MARMYISMLRTEITKRRRAGEPAGPYESLMITYAQVLQERLDRWSAPGEARALQLPSRHTSKEGDGLLLRMLALTQPTMFIAAFATHDPDSIGVFGCIPFSRRPAYLHRTVDGKRV